MSGAVVASDKMAMMRKSGVTGRAAIAKKKRMVAIPLVSPTE